MGQSVRPSPSLSTPSAHAGQVMPGHTVSSSVSSGAAQPGSFGQSSLPSPLLSRLSVHSVLHVRAPTGPPQVRPATHVIAPDWNSAPSQLPPSATVPETWRLKVPTVVVVL